MNASAPNTTRSDLRALPKAEIHVHLEGCFEPVLLERLAREAGIPMLRPRDQLFDFTGLTDFLEFLDWACGLIQTRDQLAELAYGFCHRMADSGTGYADLIVNPTHWAHWAKRIPAFIDGLDAGFKAAEQDNLPSAGLCVSLLRTHSAEASIELVELLSKLEHPRVVALSIDGNEATAGRTGPRFADAFRRAKQHGLRRTVHAGESSGAEGVRDAIELLEADRIDHGVRAIEDPSVVDLLIEKNICLGICPTSNITLGLYRSLEEHPVDRLRRAGVGISLNTDDPALLKTTLINEYAMCQSAYHWTTTDLRGIALTSIEASFANADIKEQLRQALRRW